MHRNVSIADDAALLQVQNKSPEKCNALHHWFLCHQRAATAALQYLQSHPIANAFTILVIALAFALPTIFYVLFTNLNSVNRQWQSAPQIALYLNQKASPNAITQFVQTLQHNANIASVQYISPAEGLKSFAKDTAMTQAITALKDNPLPGLVVVTPNHQNTSPTKINHLYQQLMQATIVDTGQLNLAWVKRLYDIIAILRIITISLGTLFALGVIFIIGNTIRLTLQSQKNETHIMKLIGATNRFIRRPLLYRAAFYGLIAGLLAWTMTEIVIAYLRRPADALAATYHNVITLQNLSPTDGLCLIGVGILLCLIGARAAT